MSLTPKDDYVYVCIWMYIYLQTDHNKVSVPTTQIINELVWLQSKKTVFITLKILNI